MPRRSREEAPGAAHHVWAHGIDANAIFRDFDDRMAYVALLGEVAVLCGWMCLSFCLMDTHVHLLIETPEPNLGAGMQVLHGEYAQRFNQRHGRRGHLFEQRYGSKPIKSDEQLKVVAAYIVNNPVAAGMCARPEEYPWSSHQAVLIDRAAPWLAVERLLGYFGASGGDPLARYRRFVNGEIVAAADRRAA